MSRPGAILCLDAALAATCEAAATQRRARGESRLTIADRERFVGSPARTGQREKGASGSSGADVLHHRFGDRLTHLGETLPRIFLERTQPAGQVLDVIMIAAGE